MNPAVTTKRNAPLGNHMGLVKRINGLKKMMQRTVVVTVRPVRRSKMEPEMRRVGAWSLILRRNAEVVELEKVMEWFWWGLSTSSMVPILSNVREGTRSSMVEVEYFMRYCERE